MIIPGSFYDRLRRTHEAQTKSQGAARRFTVERGISGPAYTYKVAGIVVGPETILDLDDYRFLQRLLDD